MQDYINIGYTQKTHGVHGEMKIVVEDPYLEDVLKNKRLFLDVKGVKVPYFIENLRGGDGGPLIIKLEDVSTREEAHGLQSRQVYLRPQDLIPDHLREIPVDEEEESAYANLAGYQIIDKASGPLGVIEEIIEMPQQEMAAVQYQGREVLIPLNEHFIQSIDADKKVVYMALPEGLMEL